MESFNKIIEEYDRYILGSLIGKKINVENLRKLCKEYNEDVPKQLQINCYGSDQELINELKKYFNNYIKISE